MPGLCKSVLDHDSEPLLTVSCQATPPRLSVDVLTSSAIGRRRPRPENAVRHVEERRNGVAVGLSRTCRLPMPLTHELPTFT
ncbi:hypothetical protein J6590_105716 [Homalodisca vitripennis]|nr:hypothetical protein J6590_105716 [Homalodisca vitripennis]